MSVLRFSLCACLLASFFVGCSARPLPQTDADVTATPDFRQTVQEAKDRVFPAVVYIKCLRESHETGKKITQEVSGSGVIISASGKVLTNWHVVDKAVEVRCLLLDGQAMGARIVGSDKDTDLALLQLKLPDGVTETPYATLGDSSTLSEGDFVMAMGAPWGMNRSVSIGIISCTARYLPGHSEYNSWLQTDAAISPGNSGGPLVNTDGAVVGINTRGVMRGGDTGFAIPSNTAKLLAARLEAFEKADWSWTGLQLQPLKDFNKDIYFEGADGVIVAGTDPASPARRAGILANDRIIKINGESVTGEWEENLPAIRRRLGLLTKEQAATLEIRRGDETLAVEMTPRQKGKVEGEELDCPRWDLTVKSINQFDNPDLHFHRAKGVYIYGVKYPGNASNCGLNAQDIILKIGSKEVVTLDDVKAVHAEAIENIRGKHRIVFTVLRNGLRRQVVLDFSRDYEKE